MKIRITAIAVVAATLLTGLANAQTRSIDFDTDANGNTIATGSVISNQYAAWGVTFTPNVQTPGAPSGSGLDPGTWASNTDMRTALVSGSDVGGGAAGSGNLLHSFSGWQAEDGDGNFAMTFSSPISTISALFSGIARGGWGGMEAFNGSTSLGRVFVEAPGVAGATQTVAITGVGDITSVRFYPGDFDDWQGIDNVSITLVPAPAAAAPLLGLALLHRRRRS